MRLALWLGTVGLGTILLACGGPAQSTSTVSTAAVSGPSPAPAVSIAPALASASPSPNPGGLALSATAFGVLIDNSPEARPQSGLDGADVVYEAPAEGGIPRLMALYLRDAPVDRIGPVRSARHYYVYLAAEYHVALVHIGASPQGFTALDETGLERLDETRGDGGFTRDPARQAPHDAYVSTQSVRRELERRGIRSGASTVGVTFGGFQPGPQPATRLRLAYAAGGFTAEYDYDVATRTYLRSQDGQPHADAPSGRRYAARSVIVQQLPVTPIPNDDAGRVDLGLVGTGRGLLVAEGTQVPLEWSKPNLSEPTRFRRADGAPFSLPEGQVWIELLATDAQVAASSGS